METEEKTYYYGEKGLTPFRSLGFWPQEVEITINHLLLLKRSSWGWDESCYLGATSIDVKRPYGNKDVLGDIAETFGIVPEGDLENGINPFTREQTKKIISIHHSLPLVLEVLTRTMNYNVGRWLQRSPTDSWHKAFVKGDKVIKISGWDANIPQKAIFETGEVETVTATKIDEKGFYLIKTNKTGIFGRYTDGDLYEFHTLKEGVNIFG